MDIYNAKIINWTLEKEYKEEPILLNLRLKSIFGECVLLISLDKIEKLFNILEIYNIKDLKNASCVIFVTDFNMVRTIGNFLFYDASEDFNDQTKIDSINSPQILDYDIYLQYKDKK